METPLVTNLYPFTEHGLGPDTSSVLHILYSLHSHSDPDMDTTMTPTLLCECHGRARKLSSPLPSFPLPWEGGGRRKPDR